MHATEEAPRTTSSWGLLSLYAGCKTDPGPLLEDEIALFSTLETPLANCHTTEYLPLSNDLKNGVCSLMPIIDPSHHEDPESDTSSGSGQSVSSVSTPAVPWEGESGTWDGNVSLEDCSHMPYASHMRMSEFRREQHRFNWETLSQAIVRKLYPHWPQAQAPQQIDSLYYLRHIGQGSSSSVYAAAFDGFGLNDTLAVKVLEDWRRNPTTGLPREFQIMQGLKHNHIVAFIGSFAQKHKFGVLMYPLAPYNLAQYLREVSDYNSDDRKLHQTRTKTLLTALGCLSSALFYLHVTQVIKHKDIKPENILVDRHGSMLLADFGISKKYQGDTATSGPTAFTEKYAAPEVAAQHKRDLSADVFSLGCVFLEMATVILGESLKTLDKEVFDGPGGDSWPKKAYRYCLPMVEIWMSHLKSISLREGSPWDGRPYSSPSESRVSQYEQTVGKCSLQERHLDIILAMMSECPYERPSMQDLYHVFTEFAADCFECHDSVSFQSEWHSGSVTDTWSLESTACSVGKKSSFKEQQLDIHHPRTNVPSAQVNPGVKRFRTGNPEDTAMIRKSKQVCGFTNHSAQQIIGQSDIGEVFILVQISSHQLIDFRSIEAPDQHSITRLCS
jgi:serine/threonine protein kinase